MNIPAEISDEWQTYNDYRTKGLKKQANKVLVDVVNKINSYEVGYFNKFLYSLCEKGLGSDYENRVQQPIFLKCILPILVKGVKNNSAKDIVYLVKANSYGFSREIFNEMGDICNRELLKKAINIEPQNHTAIELLGANYVYDLYYGAHHLPESFISEIDYALSLIEESDQFFKQNVSVLSTDIQAEHEYYSRLYKDYLLWHNGHFDYDFSTWCEKNNRRYSWVKSYYYE